MLWIASPANPSSNKDKRIFIKILNPLPDSTFLVFFITSTLTVINYAQDMTGIYSLLRLELLVVTKASIAK